MFGCNAALLARLQLSYPGLQPKAVARLLNVTPRIDKYVRGVSDVIRSAQL